ncbi:MAG: LytTR family transcriptional regulator DNA-binding domain-containing protein, partial [Bacteroidota bacterium]
MKPIDVEDLQNAIHKLKDQANPSEEQTKILSEMKNGLHPIKIAISLSSGFKVISIADIIRMEGAGNYAEIYLIDGTKILSTKTIRNYEELLSGRNFFRVHRSHLINL